MSKQIDRCAGLLASAIAAAVLLALIAHSSLAATRNTCLASARVAIAKDLGVRAGGLSISSSEGSNGMPQCTYRSGRVSLTVNVDNGPQAEWRLMRKVVEASQIFGPPPPGWHAPVGLYGLGPYASWFINLDSLMAVNHTHTELLMATVSWGGSKQATKIKLARAAIVPYIHARAKAHPIPVNGY